MVLTCVSSLDFLFLSYNRNFDENSPAFCPSVESLSVPADASSGDAKKSEAAEKAPLGSPPTSGNVVNELRGILSPTSSVPLTTRSSVRQFIRTVANSPRCGLRKGRGAARPSRVSGRLSQPLKCDPEQNDTIGSGVLMGQEVENDHLKGPPSSVPGAILTISQTSHPAARQLIHKVPKSPGSAAFPEISGRRPNILRHLLQPVKCGQDLIKPEQHVSSGDHKTVQPVRAPSLKVPEFSSPPTDGNVPGTLPDIISPPLVAQLSRKLSKSPASTAHQKRSGLDPQSEIPGRNLRSSHAVLQLSPAGPLKSGLQLRNSPLTAPPRPDRQLRRSPVSAAPSVALPRVVEQQLKHSPIAVTSEPDLSMKSRPRLGTISVARSHQLDRRLRSSGVPGAPSSAATINCGRYPGMPSFSKAPGKLAPAPVKPRPVLPLGSSSSIASDSPASIGEICASTQELRNPFCGLKAFTDSLLAPPLQSDRQLRSSPLITPSDPSQSPNSLQASRPAMTSSDRQLRNSPMPTTAAGVIKKRLDSFKPVRPAVRGSPRININTPVLSKERIQEEQSVPKKKPKLLSSGGVGAPPRLGLRRTNGAFKPPSMKSQSTKKIEQVPMEE